MTDKMPDVMTIKDTLDWYLEAGVDECIGEYPIDRYAESKAIMATKGQNPKTIATDRTKLGQPAGTAQKMIPAMSSTPMAPPAPQADRLRGEAALKSAVEAADSATNYEDLKAAIGAFEGCALKAMASNTVFADGPVDTNIVLVGEAPGAEEDRQGRPFCGPSGQLLDAMLASIGLDRTQVLITNTVFWRPPGNRTPSQSETALCLPFLEKLIALVDPKILVALGGPAAKTLLGTKESVSRLRGQWHEYSARELSHPVLTTVLYHPAYLLRTPAQKRVVWQDLLAIKHKLSS